MLTCGLFWRTNYEQVLSQCGQNPRNELTVSQSTDAQLNQMFQRIFQPKSVWSMAELGGIKLQTGISFCWAEEDTNSMSHLRT
ncbi:hypothetical protein CEXT_650511 [Caerostris extrusa]|uniref:Uncharacterized protein n=1 Tax=Caerostris extrusa TaxID=172846 RepID=A0AAV4MVD1_CAEEX|nr:hypothetical protein CEXT_650511 [Caerostris extrusa]